MSSRTFVAVHAHAAGVAEMQLDRPDALNAISSGLAADFADAVEEVRGSSVVVLTSSSTRSFSVGADLRERRGMDAAALLAQRPTFLRAYRALLGLEQPVIAGVDGYCIGGGFEIALTCDLIACSPGAVFALTEVTIGLIPGGGGTQLLGRRAGWAVASDLIFTGRRVSGQEAARLGIADRCGDGTGRDQALELAATVARSSPTALRLAKRSMRDGRGTDLAAALDIEDGYWRRAGASDDRVEGIAAFNEKRSPVWSPIDAG
jgi:enoyl-CoA hydratase/carnithine racemase